MKFVAKVQKQNRIAIPELVALTMQLKPGDKIIVTLRKYPQVTLTVVDR